MRIRAWSPDVCSSDLAVHRFPGSMAGRIQAVARAVVDDYDGDVTRLRRDGAPDGHEVLRRLKALPGFGEQRSEARRGGKECVRSCRSRWSPTHSQKTERNTMHI